MTDEHKIKVVLLGQADIEGYERHRDEVVELPASKANRLIELGQAEKAPHDAEVTPPPQPAVRPLHSTPLQAPSGPPEVAPQEQFGKKPEIPAKFKSKE